MSNFDDIFSGQSSNSRWSDQPFDKEAWAAKKQEERKELYALADSTAAEVSKDGDKFRQYLDVQSRFSRYTPTNALLILAQMPEATQLKDFDGWKEAGVSIQRKPRSVKILEPGREYDRDDGTRGTSFDVKRVYDVSQTRGRVRSAPTVKLDDRVLLKALIHRTPVPIQTVDSLPNSMGAMYDHNQQVIFVCRGMGAEDIFRSVSKELAHAELSSHGITPLNLTGIVPYAQIQFIQFLNEFVSEGFLVLPCVGNKNIILYILGCNFSACIATADIIRNCQPL
mgnify:CR=1 FL=1